MVLCVDGYEEMQVPRYTFVSVRKDVFYQKFSRSKEAVKVYHEILRGIEESTTQILCKLNAEIQWGELIENCHKDLEKLKGLGYNNPVKEEHRIINNQKYKRFEFRDSNLAKNIKNIRRFLPEFKNKGETESMISK